MANIENKMWNARTTLWEWKKGTLNIFWGMENKSDVQKKVNFLAENEASSRVCLQENSG